MIATLEVALVTLIELICIATLKVHLELIVVLRAHAASTASLGVQIASTSVLIVLTTVVELTVLRALWHLTIHLVTLVLTGLALELVSIVWTTFKHVLVVIIVLLEALIWLVVYVLSIECRLVIRSFVHLLGC